MDYTHHRRLPTKARPPSRWGVATAAVPLALAAMFAAPVLTVSADSVACWWPSWQASAQGDTFSDGATPTATVNVNECSGGLPGGPYDGRWYDQYNYQVTVSGKNESDVWAQARAWQCGNLVYNETRDWSFDGSLTTSWYNMGRNDGSECGMQYDLTVRITSWAGERWSTYENETNGSCPSVNDRCPTG